MKTSIFFVLGLLSLSAFANEPMADMATALANYEASYARELGKDAKLKETPAERQQQARSRLEDASRLLKESLEGSIISLELTHSRPKYFTYDLKRALKEAYTQAPSPDFQKLARLKQMVDDAMLMKKHKVPSGKIEAGALLRLEDRAAALEKRGEKILESIKRARNKLSVTQDTENIDELIINFKRLLSIEENQILEKEGVPHDIHMPQIPAPKKGTIREIPGAPARPRGNGPAGIDA